MCSATYLNPTQWPLVIVLVKCLVARCLLGNECKGAESRSLQQFMYALGVIIGPSFLGGIVDEHSVILWGNVSLAVGQADYASFDYGHRRRSLYCNGLELLYFSGAGYVLRLAFE